MSHLPGALAGALRRRGLAALTAHTYRRCQAFLAAIDVRTYSAILVARDAACVPISRRAQHRRYVWSVEVARVEQMDFYVHRRRMQMPMRGR
jgi:hypothetical protein